MLQASLMVTTKQKSVVDTQKKTRKEYISLLDTSKSQKYTIKEKEQKKRSRKHMENN